MLAVVAALGSVLLFAGIQNITDFNLFLDIVGNQQVELYNENFIIEHVRFDPNDPSNGAGKNVTLWIRNTGSVDITIDRVTLHQIENQEMVIYDTEPDLDVFVSEVKKLSYDDATTASWLPSDDIQTLGIDKQYRLSVTTTRGNTVEMIVQPYNT